jgi:glycosyltransferase involved in cell wall biosynthesis
LLEALFLGVPVVARPVGGIPEVIEDGVTGLLADSAEPSAYAWACEAVLTDVRLRERLTAAGVRVVEQAYSVERAASQMVSLYQRLNGPARGRLLSPPAATQAERPRVRSAEVPKVSIVVPVYNAEPFLKRSLDSIVAAMKNYGSAELIVVDNGSSDGSYEAVTQAYGSVAKVLQIRGVPVGVLRNAGARSGTGQYVCFIDSDCVIPKDYFHRIEGVFSAVGADAVGCMVRLPPNPHWIERTWYELHKHSSDGYVTFINSGNFALTRKSFDQTGGFSEGLLTGEDAEYCLRLVAKGYKIYESLEIEAVHLRNPKSLTSFFLKNSWHGLGMFGSLRFSWLDKPLWMTFLFLFLSVGGLVAFLLSPADWLIRMGFALMCSGFVPVLTVVYRATRRGKLTRPLRSALLYWLYYAARVYAIFVILTRSGRQAAAGGTAKSRSG